jgi:hypothetical protein
MLFKNTMKINRDNYEVFLVDYLDGKLSPSSVSELMLFLEQNPDLKCEFEGIEDAVLVAEEIAYSDKSELKKKSFLNSGIDNELEYISIASIEGVLTEPEQLKLNSEIIQNKKFERQINTYKKTILQPNSEIHFTGKAQLKRTRIVPMRYTTLRKSISIAASIGLIIGVYTIGKIFVYENPKQLNSTNNVIVSVNPPENAETKKQVTENITIAKNAVPKNRNISTAIVNTKKTDTSSNIENVPRAEFVPSMLSSIESKSVVIQKNIQYEQVALTIEDYYRQKEFANEYLQTKTSDQTAQSSYREIGLFEVLQYGVHSFGKLIGREIRLNAKKDKNGRIEEISFESKLIAFSKEIRKKEEGL